MMSVTSEFDSTTNARFFKSTLFQIMASAPRPDIEIQFNSSPPSLINTGTSSTPTFNVVNGFELRQDCALFMPHCWQAVDKSASVEINKFTTASDLTALTVCVKFKANASWQRRQRGTADADFNSDPRIATGSRGM